METQLLSSSALRGRERLLAIDTESFKREFYKTAVLSYPPRQVTVGIGSGCGFRCKFCAYHSPDAKGQSNVYGLPFKITLEDFTRIVDMCWLSRVPSVHITATGEPFLHKDVFKMIDYVSKVYGKSSIQTDFDRRVFEKKDYLAQVIKRGDAISYMTTDILSGIPEQHDNLKFGGKYEFLLSLMSEISRHTSIVFHAHLILSTENSNGILPLVEDLGRRKIRANLDIVQLHPYGFNEHTDPSIVYKVDNIEIAKILNKAKELGRNLGIPVTTPRPFDCGTNQCGSFWSRFQTWPVKGIDRDRYHENVIVGGCNAVVNGNLKSHGYIFDYEDIMQLWNNEQYVSIRENLLKGVFPDPECVTCQSYQPERNLW